MNQNLQNFFNKFRMPDYPDRVHIPFSGDAYGSEKFESRKDEVVKDDVYVCRLSGRCALVSCLLLGFIFLFINIFKMPETFSMSFVATEENVFNQYAWPVLFTSRLFQFLLPFISFIYALYFFFYRGKDFDRRKLSSNNRKKNSFFLNNVLLPIILILLFLLGYFIGSKMPLGFLNWKYSIILYPFLLIITSLCYAFSTYVLTILFIRMMPLSCSFRLYTDEVNYV